MQKITLSLDSGSMQPIVEAFNNYCYNQDFLITINHSENKKVRVDKYPLLCSIVNEIRKNGNTCNVILNYVGNCKQLNYAARMGFLSFLGINYKYPHSKQISNGRFIELRNITSSYFYPEDELLDVFQKDFNLTIEESYDISTIISELVNNCTMHSESLGGAILYCQKYPSQNYLNLFIVDSGIGINKAMHYSEKYKGLSEQETLRKSLEFGEGNGRGYGQGLFLVSQFIKKNLGTLSLVTGNQFYNVVGGKENFHYIDCNYKGVILKLRIPFVINTTIQNIMDEQLN